MIVSHFYSDPHFGHANIIKYADRPFANVQEMEDVFIQRYNETVSPEQTCFWVGDCSFRIERFAEIMKKLNGRKLLVRGNHDKSASTMARLGFDLVLDQAILHLGGRTCVVCHYPYAGSEHARGGRDDRYLDRRPERRKGEVLIHGHTHQHDKRRDNSIHVGVDSWDYRPATLEQVTELVRQV